MSGVVKRSLIGRPMASGELHDTLLPKWVALPIFASDPLSSVAYATEAALVVLVAASLGAAGDVLWVSIGIAALMTVVVLSYRQTLRAYDTSGGAYVVAKDNLGTLPALVAAASLLTDYVLTVAVSVAAGVLAITSAVPELSDHEVSLSLGFVALITFANLRGVRESGVLFAIPTYAFIGAMYAMIVTGFARCGDGSCPVAEAPDPVTTGVSAVGLLVVLRAFASGASALTGVEAISNGVTAFRPPQARNAIRTLTVMGVIAVSLFLGVSWLAVQFDALPSKSVSVVSELARAAFPEGTSTSWMFFVVQATTTGILLLAANTSYQGFPRLAALLAEDRFFPRQFVNLGDRLVYSNGIVVLAVVASLLLWTFHADVNALIHLYVIGVFTAFTISQAGMVRYWWRRREPGWRNRLAINAVGAAATGLVALLIVQTKFLDGAWMVIVAIPVIVASFYGTRRHYRGVARRLRAGAAAVRAAGQGTNTVVLPVAALDGATRRAAWFAHEIAGDRYHPIHLRGAGEDPRGRWWSFSGGGVPVELLARETTGVDAVLDYVWAIPRGESRFVTLVVPEQFHSRSLIRALRNRTQFTLKLRLLKEPGIAIASVPLVGGEEPVGQRLACRVLTSGGHAASLRACNYAQSLGIEDTRAIFFAGAPEEARRVTREWALEAAPLPLDVEETAYRDLAAPLLAHIRALTAEPGTVVLIVMPELIVRGWRRILHNQRALYIKRLLLFEPDVVLTSVPYQLP